MTDAGGSRRTGIVGLVVLATVLVVGYVLLYGDDAGRLTASGLVMAGAVVLGLLQAYRSETNVGLVGGVALILGGGYGAFLASRGRDPFVDPVVLTLVVVGLASGLFSPVPDDEEPKSAPDRPDGDAE